MNITAQYEEADLGRIVSLSQFDNGWEWEVIEMHWDYDADDGCVFVPVTYSTNSRGEGMWLGSYPQGRQIIGYLDYSLRSAPNRAAVRKRLARHFAEPI